MLGASVQDGEVSLAEAFFNPQLTLEYGIEPCLKGLAVQQIEEIDNFISDGVRNLLFAPPAAVDLGASNVQRGRDHGLADYNQVRIDMGLAPKASFNEISGHAAVVAALEAAYDAAGNGVNGLRRHQQYRCFCRCHLRRSPARQQCGGVDPDGFG